MSTEIRYERLERIKAEVRRFHPAGTTPDEMRACMEWVRSLGHEAKSLEDDGFRYRSVYADGPYPTSPWHWVEPGQWLMSIGSDSEVSIELDDAHDGPPDEDGYIGYGESWHRIDTKESA